MKKLFTATLILCFAMSAFSQNMITTSAIQEPQFTHYKVSFPEGKTILYNEYEENKYALKNIISHINKNISKLRTGEYYIAVESRVKDEGKEHVATRLARKRALTLKSYLIKTVGAKEEYFKTTLKVNNDPYLIEGIDIALAPSVPVKDNPAIVVPVKKK
ncbi:MAG: hypothetical protein IKT29_01820 [Flavobacteriales bacterium]|nr:hypothetical protein [Flavobacteriales bacterium]